MKPASATLPIRSKVPLAPRTTFELGGDAEWFLEATSVEMLVAGLDWADREGIRVTILGGGSNSLVPDAGVEGLVVVPALRGVSTTRAGEVVDVTARAGEVWDPLVATMVDSGYAGIEALSGIPGSVGATPIQNVGAYGVEVGDVLTRVTVIDRSSRTMRTFERAELGLAYRDSRLKREPDRFVVVEVELRLRVGAPSPARYAELERALPPFPTLLDVRETVLRLRRAKSMVLDADDPNRRSAGSFFTNPIVDAATAERVIRVALARGLARDAAGVPHWPLDDGRVKLAAGWLLERSGVQRGERHGHVGVSTAHALALVHHGGGSTRELLALAEDARARVRAAFDVELVREPILLGAPISD